MDRPIWTGETRGVANAPHPCPSAPQLPQNRRGRSNRPRPLASSRPHLRKCAELRARPLTTLQRHMARRLGARKGARGAMRRRSICRSETPATTSARARRPAPAHWQAAGAAKIVLPSHPQHLLALRESLSDLGTLSVTQAAARRMATQATHH